MRDDIVSEIKHRLPIEQYIQKYITLRRNGSRWTGLCPFHQEKSASFTVNPTSGFFYCFGCHASGDLFSFVERYHGMEFREALIMLAEELGLSIENMSFSSASKPSIKHELLSMYKIANTHFVNNLHKSNETRYLEYFRSRGLSLEIIKCFSLGYSLSTWHSLVEVLRRAGFSKEAIITSGLVHTKNNNLYDVFRDRYIFPIISIGGSVIAFGGRVHPQEQGVKEVAKYINSPETPIYTKGKVLYGLPQARKSITIEKTMILTEGYVDVLTLHQYGYTNAVAVLGTALTKEHARTIASFASTAELVFDADTAGKKASLAATKLLLSEGVRVRVISMPQGEDIDSFLRTFGKDAFDEQRARAKEGLSFCIECVQTLSPKEISAWIQEFISGIEDSLLLAQYTKQLASGFGISEESIYSSTSPLHNISTQVSSPPPSHALSKKEYTILRHLLTYPHNINEIQNAGLDLALHSQHARDIAQALYKQGDNHQAIYTILTPETQSLFAELLIDIEPCDKEQHELQDILAYLRREYLQRNTASARTLITDINDIEGLSRIQNIISCVHNTE